MFEVVEHAPTIRLAGELDLASVPVVADVLQGLVGAGGYVTLDLERLTFCDSTGIALLLRAGRALNGRGGLILRHCRGEVRRLLQLSLPDGAPGMTGDWIEEPRFPRPGDDAADLA
ncbi:MAG TPA: STAS domain-containing protein [Actinomycetota bacterium]